MRRSPVLLGIGQGALTATSFAAQHPTRLRGLAIYGGSAGGRPTLDADIADIRAQWGAAVFLDREAPSMRNDAPFRRWLALFTRMSATAASAIGLLKLDAQIDLRSELPRVRVPTLVLHRTGDRAVPIAAGRELADQIGGARFAEIPGEDHLPFAGDPEPFAAELARFMASHRP